MEFSSTSNGRRLWRPRHNLSSNSVGGVCVKSQLCHAISLPNPNPIYNKVYPLVFHPFISSFPHLKNPAFQKESFCIPKRVLLLTKRSPFAIQNESFYSPKGVLLQNHRIAPIIQSGFCCNLEVLLY